VTIDSPGVQADLYQLTAGLDDGAMTDVAPEFNSRLPQDCLLATHGIRLVRIGRGAAVAEMSVKAIDLNQRGIAQAGAIVALADAAAGWASYSAIEHGGFTTVNLTTSLLSAARAGDVLRAQVTPVRIGRRVHVLDVSVVSHIEGAAKSPTAVARFTCTQLVLTPPAGSGSR
jgi:uncharacterized protein (TIGR00369 family)